VTFEPWEWIEVVYAEAASTHPRSTEPTALTASARAGRPGPGEAPTVASMGGGAPHAGAYASSMRAMVTSGLERAFPALFVAVVTLGLAAFSWVLVTL
jgi:hypothetical protein